MRQIKIQDIKKFINSYPKNLHSSIHSERKIAAVLAIFLKTKNGLHLCFTKRSKKLNDHPGQISFPGGKNEIEDKSLLQTALRETFEEIGIKKQALEILGPLPVQNVKDKWIIYPFAAYCPTLPPLSINFNEVDSVIFNSLDMLLEQHSQFKKNFADQKAYQYILNNGEILWGATASIVGNFLNFYFGKNI